MNDNSTENPARLPLAERARLGLLLAEPELVLNEVLELEQPADKAARKTLGAALRAAIKYGNLTPIPRQTEGVRYEYAHRPIRFRTLWDAPIWDRPNPPTPTKKAVAYTQTLTCFDRESYRQWRLTCPPDLLSPLSQIHKWLGATPAIETSLPATSGKRQRDDALTHAIRAAIAVLSPDGALPRARELFDYLKTSDATETIVDSGKDSLTWYSAETNKKQIATVTNLKRRLDRWKT